MGTVVGDGGEGLGDNVGGGVEWTVRVAGVGVGSGVVGDGDGVGKVADGVVRGGVGETRSRGQVRPAPGASKGLSIVVAFRLLLCMGPGIREADISWH